MTAGGHVSECCGAVLLGAVSLLALGAPSISTAQEPTESVPQVGFRAEFLVDLARVEDKLLSLAEAIPAEHYGWRPAEGVRSISEACMHLAEGNHRILEGVGWTVPGDLEDMESITDKQEVIAALKASLIAVRQTVLATSDEALEGQVDFFGRQWSRRAIFYQVGTHMHEHLGQLVAYARSIGIPPPWSSPRGGG